MLIYATAPEVEAARPTTREVQPDMLQRLLVVASGVVRKATRHARYRTDDDHMPTSETLRHVFRDATIAQVGAWVENGLANDVLSGGVSASATLASTSSNGKSVTLNTTTADDARLRMVQGGLCAEAETILDSMGLLGGSPGVVR